MNIILIGPQGSGKGTQADLLKNTFGLRHLSPGEIIRHGIEAGEATALKFKEYMDKGELVPDEIIIQLIKEHCSEQGNIFDGFPRNLEQAHALDDFAHVDFVIEIALTDEEAVKRISSRRQCKECKAIFGQGNPPKEEGKCDKCEGELYQREDDQPEAVKKRLTIYRDQTEPLLEYYKPRNIVHSVDGSESVEGVFKAISNIVQTTAE